MCKVVWLNLVAALIVTLLASNGAQANQNLPAAVFEQGVEKSDPAVLEAIKGAQSLTITGWLRTKADIEEGENQYIISVPGLLQLAYHGKYKGRLGLILLGDATSKSRHVWSSWQAPFFAKDQWVFFAVTFDGQQEKNNVAFYVGTKDASITRDVVASTAAGPITSGPAESVIVGAYDRKGKGRFDGMLDNLRVFASKKTDNLAALTEAQIEAVRQKDLRLEGSLTKDKPQAASQPANKNGGKIVSRTALAVVTVDALDRVFTDRMPSEATSPEPINVPRGGFACFQFAVSSASDVLITCKVGKIASAGGVQLRGSAKTYQLVDVHVEANNNGGGRTSVKNTPPGTWMEALIRKAPFDLAEVMFERNQLSLKPGRTGAVLLEIEVGDKATPGLYRGELHFRQGDQAVDRPFSFWVHKTLLPADGWLSATYWLSLDPKDLTNGDVPKWWSEDHWRLLEQAGRALRRFGQDSIPVSLINEAEPLIRTIRHCNGSYSFDFSRFDRLCKLFLDLGFKRLEGQHVGGGHTLKMPPMAGGLYMWHEGDNRREGLFPRDATVDDWLAFLPTFYRALSEHLAQKGWTDNYFQYLMDEPHDLQAYKKLSDITHKHLPGVKTQDAVNSEPADYSPMVDVHVFALSSLARNQKLADERRAKGTSVWLYHCCSPYPPYPNRHLDERLSNSRLYPWLAYLLKAEGYLYWAANRYRGADPYLTSIGPVPSGSQDPGHPPGDNWFFYPDKDGLLGSLRMVAFREGLIDHRLLTMLAKRDVALADNIREQIVRTAVDYQKDPASFHDVRKRLLEALDMHAD